MCFLLKYRKKPYPWWLLSIDNVIEVIKLLIPLKRSSWWTFHWIFWSIELGLNDRCKVKTSVWNAIFDLDGAKQKNFFHSQWHQHSQHSQHSLFENLQRFLVYHDDIKKCLDDRQWCLERARGSQFCAHALSAITATNLCSYAEFPSGEPKHNCHNRKSYSTFMALYSLPTNVFAKNLREMKYPIISHFSQFVI